MNTRRDPTWIAATFRPHHWPWSPRILASLESVSISRSHNSPRREPSSELGVRNASKTPENHHTAGLVCSGKRLCTISVPRDYSTTNPKHSPVASTATGEDPILRCPDAIELHDLVPVIDVAYLHNQLPFDDLRGTAKAPSIKFSGGGQRELE